LRSFSALEKRQAAQETLRVAQGIAAELEDLAADVMDYSVWDDTCNFVAGADTDYPARNLIDSFYEGFRLNLAVILDDTGRMVWGEGFSLVSGERMPLPTTLGDHLLPGAPCSLTSNPEERRRGVTLTGW
jgi:sensor domain CHASE-containing protein